MTVLNGSCAFFTSCFCLFFYGKRNFREFLQLRRFIAVNSLFVYFYWLKKNIILCGNFCTFVGYKKGKKGGRKLYDEALFTFI